MRTRTVLQAALVLAMAGHARAQLVIGTDAPAGDTAWLIDVASGQADPLWSGVPVFGIGVDDPSRILYVSDGVQLLSWSYNSPNPPVVLGTITNNGLPLSTVGLAFANGKLYGVTNGSTVFEIDPTTQVATLLWTLPGGLVLGGLDFNPADGLFYGTNDGTSAGIYSIDVLGTGASTFVAPYPAGSFDVDGCAVGDNKVYLVEDEPNPIAVYDLSLGAYTTSIPTPITTANVWSGGGWAPSLKLIPPPVGYCTAKVNSLGCLPAIGSVGVASAGLSSGFVVQATNVHNQKAGVLLYSLTGRDVVPFQGGVLCLAGPIYRTPARSSGGTLYVVKDCSGVWRIDMNAFAAEQFRGHPQAGLRQPGNYVHCQWWGRDPNAATGTALTDALQYVIGP